MIILRILRLVIIVRGGLKTRNTKAVDKVDLSSY